MALSADLGKPAALLALFGALYCIDLGGTGVFDYDEAAYAEVARQMHRSGDWLNPVLNGELFYTLQEAQILIERWRREYNEIRPHSSLAYQPPAPEAVEIGPPISRTFTPNIELALA